MCANRQLTRNFCFSEGTKVATILQCKNLCFVYLMCGIHQQELPISDFKKIGKETDIFYKQFTILYWNLVCKQLWLLSCSCTWQNEFESLFYLHLPPVAVFGNWLFIPAWLSLLLCCVLAASRFGPCHRRLVPMPAL